MNPTASELILNENGELQMKKRRSIKPYLYLLWAFFIPALVFLTVYIIRGVYPFGFLKPILDLLKIDMPTFGENSVLVLDLNAQYVYFFEAFRDFLHGETSIIYSWRRALGGEFIGIFAYYLASPFSFIVGLFPEGHITEALLTMFTLKCGLSGLNFCIYLHATEKNCSRVSRVIFSCMYALMSFAIVNAHNTMWIDALLFLPLIVLGVEKLVSEKKYWLYVIALTVTLIANFYIGYMICIFVALYYFYYFFSRNENNRNNACGEDHHFLRSFGRILLFSIICVLIACIIILPTYYSLTFGKTTFSEPTIALTQKFDFLDLFAKALPGSYDTVRPNGFPFIYCGLLSLLLLPVYFAAKTISPREKIFSGVLLTILVFSFNASLLDLVWHGMQVPNWLNYRYSFMFCFLVVVLAFRAFVMLDKIEFKSVYVSAAVIVALVLVIQKLEYSYVSDLTCVWVTLICIGAYLVTLYAIHAGWMKSTSLLVLAILVTSELLCNAILNTYSLHNDVIFSSRTSYVSYVDKYKPAFDYLDETDPSFYRSEKMDHRKVNDAMAIGFNGLSNSTSTLNASTILFLNRMGYASKSHWSKYIGGTPVSNSLLGIKYLVADPLDELDQYYTLMEEYEDENQLKIYRNEYALSLAAVVNDRFADIDAAAYHSPFEFTNQMVTAMLGETETVALYKPLKLTDTVYTNCKTSPVTEYIKYEPKDTSSEARVIFTYHVDSDDELFFFIPTDYPREVALTCNGKNVGTFFANESDCVLPLGVFKEGDIVRIGVTLKKSELYILAQADMLYALDTDLYKQTMPRLTEGNYLIEEYTDTSFIGKVTATEEKNLLYTSIPYDLGWHFVCDGVELAPVKTLDALMAVELPVGEHTLEIYYFSDAMLYGILLSITGVALLLVVVTVDLLSRKRAKRRAGVCADPLYTSLPAEEKANDPKSAEVNEANKAESSEDENK